nr:MAG TPA: hypothetical protein [Caudoviricetes sp.]
MVLHSMQRYDDCCYIALFVFSKKLVIICCGVVGGCY